MIIFNNNSTSPWMTALTLTLIFLCLLISSILNPTVFLYNKKKTSIAGLLFCIISATDFTICIFYPITTLYYAASLNLTDMGCHPDQPQQCWSLATNVNLATGLMAININSVILLTTGFLAIVRSIQIANPFYRLKKLRALFVLVSAFAAQSILWTLKMFSPFGVAKILFRVASFMSTSKYEESLQDNVPKRIRDIVPFIQIVPVLFAQACAVVASAFSAFMLFRQRNHAANPDHTKSRITSAVKVMLTNLPSLIYTLILGTPIFLSIIHRSEKATELDGWLTFWTTNMLPLFSSVWNPIVFISLTPKSREYVLSIARCMRQMIGA